MTDDSKYQRADDRGQMTDDSKYQRADDRGQRTDDRGQQVPEGRGQRADDRGQRTARAKENATTSFELTAKGFRRRHHAAKHATNFFASANKVLVFIFRYVATSMGCVEPMLRLGLFCIRI